MSWTPRPGTQGVFERGIVLNSMTILTRDMKHALDYFFPAENYPDFEERNLGQIGKISFPCLAIGPRENPVDDSDDSAYVIEAPAIDIYIGVVGESAADVTTKIMSYVQVADSVLRNAKNDFFNGVTVTMSNPFGLSLEIKHTYGPIGEKESTYFRGAMLLLTVHLNER